ncbi:hypothetical protein B0A53_00072 [Rhodotorula sp. CCFEE 5036]|nr:hypothetical protein B0A53_00072 [Rhodotorula sp. CCFEE 5036]
MTDIQDVPALIAPPWVVAYAYGPAQIGNTIQIFLLGVFTTMFARYASAGELRRHGTLGQVALWSSLVLNWVYTGLCVYESYYAAVSQKRAVHDFLHGRPMRISLPVVGGSIGVLTQCFLSAHAGVLIPRKAWRIVFYVWMGLLMATQVVGYVSQFVGAIRDLRHLPDRPFTSQIGTTFSLWLWAAATADISISLVCAISLKSRLHGYTREVDSLLHRLVIICFRTAAYTSLMAIVAAILATIYHANFTLHLYITFAFWLGLPALYGIALFTFSTSSREAIKGRSRAADFDTSAAAVAAAATGDEGKAAPARPTTRVRHIQVGSSASRITSTASRIPLKVRVDREEVVAVEEPEFEP